MEVHHHPHIKEKKFKEYFLEFLMIFLAVTMGFFAESIRERISNKEHAKLLTGQLINDLKKDTLNLQRVISFEKKQKKIIDTLYLLLQEPIGSTDKKLIQQLVLNSMYLRPFTPSGGAISAIEKELNIKQFAGSKLPSFIADYENEVKINNSLSDLLFRLLEQNIAPFIYEHFAVVNAYNAFSKGGLVTENKMRNLTQENMTELNIKMQLITGVINSTIQESDSLKKKATELMQFTNNTYHPEVK
jgi:hypothetical protein